MVRPGSFLAEADQQLLIHICQDPTINQIYTLAKEFAAMVRGRQVEALDDWLVRCQNSSSALLQQFGLRLQLDYDAVQAALASEWSNARGKLPKSSLSNGRCMGKPSWIYYENESFVNAEPHKVRKS